LENLKACEVWLYTSEAQGCSDLFHVLSLYWEELGANFF
jgi:hypothetical protein